MSDHCTECGRTVDPDECSVSWDDAEPVYTCSDCCHYYDEEDYRMDRLLNEGPFED